VDITPPVGAPLIGFAGRGPATGVADPLTATALFVQSGGPDGHSVAIVACDLEGIDSEWTDEVRDKARAATGLTDLEVIVAASHTHYAPAGPSMDNEGVLEHPLSIAYTHLMVFDIVGAIVLAESRARSAVVRAVVGESHVGINRRETTEAGDIVLGHNEDGPRDPRVALVVVEADDGAEIASLVGFACHPVCLGGECREISADFVGPLRSTVERITGAPLLFLQGAAGDINPRTMGVSAQTPLDTALPLAAEVMRLRNLARSVTPAALTVRVSIATFDYAPLLPASVHDARSTVDQLATALYAAESVAAPDASVVGWTRLRLSRAVEALDTLESGEAPRSVQSQQFAVALTGDVAIATAPCELFTVLGEAIVSGSPFPFTVFAGYANGLIGYVPDRASYAEGGYEVTHGTLVAEGVGEDIARNAIGLLEAAHRAL
jgi:hypothetical protein